MMNCGIITGFCIVAKISLNRCEDIVSFKKEPYEYKVLVKNKSEILNVFPELEIERASLEDIMLFYVKGEM